MAWLRAVILRQPYLREAVIFTVTVWEIETFLVVVRLG